MTDEPQEQIFAGYTTGVPRTIAERLIALRRKYGMTASDLARKSGVDRSNISRIESGRHEPSAATIEKLAKALGIRPGDLLSANAAAVPSVGIVSLNENLSASAQGELRDLLRDLQAPLLIARGSIELLKLDPTLPDTERMRNLLKVADQSLHAVTDAIARYVATQEADKFGQEHVKHG